MPLNKITTSLYCVEQCRWTYIPDGRLSFFVQYIQYIVGPHNLSEQMRKSFILCPFLKDLSENQCANVSLGMSEIKTTCAFNAQSAFQHYKWKKNGLIIRYGILSDFTV